MCSMLLSYYFHKIGRSAINGGMDFFIDNHIFREGRGEGGIGEGPTDNLKWVVNFAKTGVHTLQLLLQTHVRAIYVKMI